MIYAQTNLQLFKQLQDSGYSERDQLAVCDAYKFAVEIFTASFRPSGKTLLAHLIGTASIACWLHSRVELINAGLLHAAYTLSDFGGFAPLKAKRQIVSSRFGKGTEELIFAYLNLDWSTEKIKECDERFVLLTPIQRDALLLRLMNELEDCLDLGVLYCANSEQRCSYLANWGTVMVELANRLEQPALAAEMNSLFKEVVWLTFPAALADQRKSNGSVLVPPKSYSRKTAVAAKRLLMNQIGKTAVGVRLLKKIHSFGSENRKANGKSRI